MFAVFSEKKYIYIPDKDVNQSLSFIQEKIMNENCISYKLFLFQNNLYQNFMLKKKRKINQKCLV